MSATSTPTPALQRAGGARRRAKAAAARPHSALPALRPVSLAVCLLGAVPLVWALPTGPVNTHGQATVQTTAPGQMLIQQQTPKAALDWTSFSIAAGEKVQVVQPGATSVLLNRVLGENPSLIYGALQSNGAVWLINPRGIVFGAGSRVDVGGLVASTLGLNDDALQSGRVQLGAGAGGAGELRSEGHITAIDGSVVLVAPQLLHSGLIEARRVGLAAASEVLVDVEGDGLIFFNVKNETLDARLQLLGSVRADGGLAEVRAAARAGFADSVLNVDGIVQARGLGARNGKVVIDGGRHGITSLAGTVDVSNASGTGGDARVLGEKVLLDGGALVDASGRDGGGQARIGGDWQGQAAPDIHNAEQLVVRPGAEVRADAQQQGDGGLVVLWSEQATRFHGHVSARGGAAGGNGGLAEVSGKEWLDFQGTADLSAAAGLTGTLLLDPTDIEIVTTGDALPVDPVTFGTPPGGTSRFTPASLVARLDGANVVLQATNDITVVDPVDAGANAGSGNLGLQAGNNVIVNGLLNIRGDVTLSSNTNTAGVGAGANPAGFVQINQPVTAAGGLTITNNSGGTGIHTVAANVNAASLAPTGSLRVTGTSTWALGSALGAAAVTVAGTGTLTLPDNTLNGTTLTVETGGTLTNNGTNTAGALSLSGTLNGATLLNAASAAFNGGTVSAPLTLTGNATSIGATSVQAALSAVNLDINAGVLNASAPLTTSGTFTVASGAELRISQAGFSIGNLAGSGKLGVRADNVTLTGVAGSLTEVEVTGASSRLILGNTVGTRLSDSAAVSVGPGGTLQLGDTPETIGSLALAGGTVDGSGLGVAGAVTSSVTGTLPAAIASAGSLAVTGGILSTGGEVPTNAIQLTGGSLSTGNTDHLRAATVLTVDTGSTLTLGGTNTINTLNLGGTLAAGSLLTAGTVNLTNGATVAGGFSAATLNSSGSVAVNTGVAATSTSITSGTLTLAGALDSNTIVVSAGTLLLNGNGLLTGAGPINVTVASGATLSMGGTATISSLVLGGTLSGASTLSAATLNANVGSSTPLITGTVNVSGTTTVGSTAVLSVGDNGAAGAITGSGSTALNAGGVLAINRNDAVNLADVIGSGAITGSGTLRQAGSGTLTLDRSITGTPRVAVAAGSTLNVATSRSVTTLDLAGTLSGTGPLTATTLNLQPGGRVQTPVSGTALNATGSGTARLEAASTYGNLTVANGATLVLDTGSNVANNTAVTVSSGGTLELGVSDTVGTLVVAGTLTGPHTLTSTGLTTLQTGAQVASGTTFIGTPGGTAGNNSDTNRLSVTGTATINGKSNHTRVEISNTGRLSLGTSGDNLANAATVNIASNGRLTLQVDETVDRKQGTGGVIGDCVAPTTCRLLTNVLELTDGEEVDGNNVQSNGLISTGNTRISGAVSITGNVQILPGTTPPGAPTGSLTVGSVDGSTGSLTATGTIDVASGTTLIYNRNGAPITLTGTYTGAGTFRNDGSATIQIGGLTGTLGVATVSLVGGNLTLQPDNANRLLDNAVVNVPSGRSLTVSSAGETIGTLNLGGTLAAGNLLTADNVNLSSGAIVNGSFNATTALTSAGATSITTDVTAASTAVNSGTLSLAAALASNTVNLSGGNLSTVGANRLASGATVTVATGSTLTLGDTNTITTLNLGGTLAAGSLLTAGNINLGNGAVVNGSFNATTALSSTGTTAINIGVTAASTTVTGGTLTLGGALASNTVNLSGGNLGTSLANLLNDGATVTVASGRTLTLGGIDTIQVLNLDGTLGAGSLLTATSVSLGNGAVADSGFSATTALTSAGATTINGAASATATTVGSGTLTLAGTLASATVNLSGGSLNTTAADRLADNTALTLNTGSTLSLGGADTVGALTLAGGTLAGSGLSVGGAVTSTVNGTLPASLVAAGSLVVTGGTLTAAALVPTTTVQLSGGSLDTTAAGLLGAATVVSLGTGSTLNLGGATTVAGLSLAGGTLAGSAVTVSGAVTSAATQALPALIASAGSLEVTTGTLSASATVPTDSVLLNGGSLSTDADNRLRSSATVTVNTGSTLTLGGTNTLTTLNLGGTLAAGGPLTADRVNLTNGAVVNGGFTATTALNSTGATAINTAVTAASTTITGGTLTLAAALASNTVTLGGGNLTTTLGDVLANGAALDVGTASTLSLGGADAVATLSLGGTLAAGGTLTTSGLATLSAGATLNGGLVAASLGVSGNTAINSAVQAVGTATLSGGTVTLAAPGTLSAGSLLLSGGNVTTTAADRLGDTTPVTVNAGSLLTLGGPDTVAALNLGGTLAAGNVFGALSSTGASTLSAGAIVNAPLTAPALTVSGNAALNAGVSISGAVQVTGGSLTVGNGATAGALTAATITVDSPAVLVFNRSDALSLGNVSGTGTVRQNGSGNLTLTGRLTTAALQVDNGSFTLAAADNDRLGDSTAVSVGAATFTVSNASETLGTLSLAGSSVGGTGTLTVNGALTQASGNSTLSTAVGAGSFLASAGSLSLSAVLNTGSVLLNGGNLSTSTDNLLADGASLTVNTGSTLTLGGADTVSSLALGGTVNGGALRTTGTSTLVNGAVVNSGLTAAAVTSSGSTALNGAVSASSLTVTGGTLTLGGVLAGNSVAVDGGSLVTGGVNRLATTAGVSVATGASLQLGGANTIATLALGGTLAAGAGTLTTSGSTTLSQGAVVNGSLAAASLNSSGSTAINVATTVSGTTTLTGGTLTLAAPLASNTVNLNGGTLSTTAANLLADGADLTVANGSVLSLGGSDTVGTLTLSGRLLGSTLTASGTATLSNGAIVDAALVAAAVNSSGTTAVNRPLTVATGLTISSGRLTLADALNASSLNLSGGDLETTAANLLADSMALTVGTGRTLRLGGADSVATLALAGSLAAGGTLTTTGLATLTDGALIAAPLVSQSLTASGNTAVSAPTSVLTTATLTGGLLTLSAALDADSVSLAGGSLLSGAANLLRDTATLSVANGSTLTLGGNDTVGALSLGGTLAGPGRLTTTAATTLTEGARVDGPLAAGTLSASGATVVNGAVAVAGATQLTGGTLTLAGTLASDIVQLNGGHLTTTAANLLADSATVTVANGSTLTLGAADTIASLTLAGRLAGAGQTLTASGSTTLQAGAVADANLAGATLNVSGNATLNGSAAQAAVTVNAGTLSLGDAERLSDTATTTVASGATLLLGGTETVGTLTLAGTLGAAGRQLNAASYTLQANASVLADLGTGTLTSTGNATLSGTSAAATVNINAGTLTLGAANRLADNATVNVASGATLLLNGDDTVFRLALSGLLGGTGTLSASIYTLSGGTYNSPLGSGELTVSADSTLNATSAATQVTIEGGTLTLGGNNRFTAQPAVTVNAGAGLTLGGDENVGSLTGAGTVALATFTLTHLGLTDSTFSGTFTGATVGSGGLVKTGAGSFTIAGSGSYTGRTLVSAGTLNLNGTLASQTLDVDGGQLVLGAAQRLADTAAVTVRNGAVLQLNGDETVGSLALTGTLNGSGRLDAGLVALNSGTVNTALGGGTLSSTGTSLLGGTSAATTVSVTGGTLTLAAADRLTAAPAATVAGGATLALQGVQTLGSLAGSGRTELGSFTLTTGSGGSSTFNGVIAGSGGLTKTGPSTFTLGGSNSYSGATQVLAGTLATSMADALPDGSALTVASGATLALGGNDRVASLVLAGLLNGTGTLTAASYLLDGGNAAASLGPGTLTSRGSSTLAATSAAAAVVVDSGTLTLASANRLADGAAVAIAAGATLSLSGDDAVASLTAAGTLGGSGTLTAATYTLQGATINAHLGAGTLASTGSSTLAGLAGAGTVAVNGGTLNLAAADRLANAAQVTVASGATLRLNGNDTVSSLALAGTLAGSGRLSASSIALDSGTANTDVATGTLTSAGNSRLAAAAEVQALNVDSGTLTLAPTAALAAGSITNVAAGAVLALGGNQTLASLAGAGEVQLGSFTLTTGSDGSSSRFDGVISGGGGLSKAGAGTFTLGGLNTYGGATTVLAGTLATAVVNTLPDTTALSVASGATLALGGNDSIATLLLNGSLQGSGTLAAATYTLDGGNVQANLGAGRLLSSGSSTLAGSAAATEVVVNGGSLVLTAPNRLADGATVTVNSGATLQLGGDDTIARADIAGTLAGTGTLNAATVALAGGRVDAALGGGLLTSIGSSQLNGTSAAQTVNVESGSLTLGAAQRLLASPALSLAENTSLMLAGNETLGSLAGTGNVALGAATLRTGSGGSSSYGGSLAGSGGLVKEGNGVFTLSGVHSYTGATVVEAGTLALAAPDRLSDAGAVAVASGATLALAGNDTVASLVLAGTLGLAPGSSGTLTATSYTLDGGTALASLGAGSLQSTGSSRLAGSSGAGSVQVNSGTLTLAAADRLADTATVAVASGATLALSGNDTIDSLALAGTLGLSAGSSATLSAGSYSLDSGTVQADLGSGVLRSSGSSRLDGRSAATTLNVDSGSLTLGAADRLADSLALVVASGAAVVLNANDSIGSLALAGVLTGTGTLTAPTLLLDGGRVEANLGTGTLTARGASTLAGAAGVGSVVVESGTLTLASAQRLSALPVMQVNGGARLAFGGDQALGSLGGAGEVVLGSFTLSTGSSGSSSFAGVISGSGGLIKQGSSSIFTLTGANSYSGATRIDAGTLRVGDGALNGSLASTAFETNGTLSFARSDDITLAQPVSGSGGVEQAGNGRLLFSGSNKTYTGDTVVSSGELATAGADALPDGSLVRVAAGARLALGGRETVRGVDADGSVSLGTELLAGGDLLMRGAVSSAGAVQLSGERIAALNEGNRFGGTVSLTAGGELTLSSGREAGVARDLVLGTVNAAAGGRVDAGLMRLAGVSTVSGGTLTLVASAPLTVAAPGPELDGRQITPLPIAFAADAVVAEAGSRLNVASGAGLNVVAANGGSVQLLRAENSFLGNLSVIAGTPDSPWAPNSTALNFGSGTLNYAVQSRVRLDGGTINVGGAGIMADVVSIRADRLATSGTAAIVARLPFDSTSGTASSLPALTLELTPAAFQQSFPFGSPGAEGGLRVSVGSREYGNRTTALDAGYVTVLPRDGASGTTAVLLRGPVVNPSGGYRFFFDGAGSQTQIPVFYNGVLPTTPQVENSISATVAVSEGARKAGFDDAVRTENVAVRLRAGVIAEVGPAPAATQGTDGLRVPDSCAPAAGALLCGSR